VFAASVYEAAVFALAEFRRSDLRMRPLARLAHRYLAATLVTSMESPVSFPVSVTLWPAYF
jgi:hypothetical protein